MNETINIHSFRQYSRLYFCIFTYSFVELILLHAELSSYYNWPHCLWGSAGELELEVQLFFRDVNDRRGKQKAC